MKLILLFPSDLSSQLRGREGPRWHEEKREQEGGRGGGRLEASSEEDCEATGGRGRGISSMWWPLLEGEESWGRAGDFSGVEGHGAKEGER